ncbi:hypothetical protein [Stratiformator vulcanicus]|uniref:Uncharacterized protein n=1 Tax=Stratiformator vulcanicus TaxID=2527980 RepID=A0A517R1L1_9PLAN|nr:hypothetical protein [Stratiformator vulcanicus]QDT37734.1 hypothetical protein Pan189_21160 [Stratiformator vulcanicus]
MANVFEFVPGRWYRFHYPGGFSDEARCKGFDQKRQTYLVEFRGDPGAVVTLTDLLINAYKFEEIPAAVAPPSPTAPRS